MVKKCDGSFSEEMLSSAKLQRFSEVPGKGDFDLICLADTGPEETYTKCKKCKKKVSW